MIFIAVTQEINDSHTITLRSLVGLPEILMVKLRGPTSVFPS